MSLSSGFHPQSNGQTERMNQVMEIALHYMVSGNPSSWCQHLLWVEYAHNSLTSSLASPHSSVYMANLRFSLFWIRKYPARLLLLLPIGTGEPGPKLKPPFSKPSTTTPPRPTNDALLPKPTKWVRMCGSHLGTSLSSWSLRNWHQGL